MKYLHTIIFIFFLLFAFSCAKDEYETIIPDSYVSFGINLQQYPSFSNGKPSYLICPDDLYSKLGGFGYANGIILYHNLFDDLVAFDMCCTNPDCVNKRIKVILDKSAGTATCPSCGSLFNLLIGYGDVLEGPAKYPLRMYPTKLSGDYLSVSLK